MPESIACPTCGAPVATAAAQRLPAFPFCSSRCRLRDLGAWCDGRFVVPGDELTASEDGRIDRPLAQS